MLPTVAIHKFQLQLLYYNHVLSDRFNTRITLLQKLKKRRDDEAWNDFYSYYAPFIKGLIRRFLANEEDVEDCSQIILVSIWKSLPNFNYDPGKGRFRSWLITISRNKVNNYLHKTIREKEKRTSLTNNENLEITENEFDVIALQEWQSYISGLAWQNISGQFSDSALDIFKRALSGSSNKDIAKHLSMNANTVAVYKKRVRVAMKQEIIRLQAELG